MHMYAPIFVLYTDYTKYLCIYVLGRALFYVLLCSYLFVFIVEIALNFLLEKFLFKPFKSGGVKIY